MLYRLLVAIVAVCLGAMAQSLTIAQLISFIQSNQKMIKEGKSNDRELAGFLSKVTLKEKLDDRTIEDLQGSGKLGPKTLEALKLLRDHSQALAVAPAEPVGVQLAPIPPPSSVEQAAIIDEVREYGLNYSKNLPDYICTQVTRRYAAPKPGTRGGGPAGGDPIWYLQDTLTIKLSYFEQKEDYKLVMINNTVTKQDYRTLGGATEAGAFGSMMRQIFEPATEAHFEWDHWATLRGRPTMDFAYRVAQDRSQWHVTYERKQDIVPAYRGLICVDKETHQVTRITLEAVNMPADFPVKSASTVLDYDYQDLSGHTFLLPLKSTSILGGDDYLNKLDEEFRIYRKYSAESELKFDTETPAPLPDDKTKEIKK